MSSPAVSHHLRQLKDSGLIVSRRVGKEVFYLAADTEVAQLLHQLIERTTHGWPGDPVHNAQFMFGGQQIARRIDSLGDMAPEGFVNLFISGQLYHGILKV